MISTGVRAAAHEGTRRQHTAGGVSAGFQRRRIGDGVERSRDVPRLGIIRRFRNQIDLGVRNCEGIERIWWCFAAVRCLHVR